MTVTVFFKTGKRGEMQLMLWTPQRVLQPREERFFDNKAAALI
jgi:hypothetical protein